MEKSQINYGCIGCGVCVSITDNIIIKDGQAKIIKYEDLEGLESAKENCPVSAFIKE